jgi:hypothetical protein
VNYSATQEFPGLCVSQNTLSCLHDSVFVLRYCAILIHYKILRPISLVLILIHYLSILMRSFAGVLIDNLHKISIIVFVISRVYFVASVLFNILMNEKLQKLSA